MVKGRVTEENSGMALPFVNLLIQGTTNGSTTDTLGNFQLALLSGRKHDTLLISSMGYEIQKIPISPLGNLFLNIELKPTSVNLKEAIIRPGENPAFRILRKVIANKSLNDPENLQSYAYDVYHKVEFDMNNFTEKIKQNLFLRSFNFIFKNADTTADGVNYLPILLTESNSEIYYRNNPPIHKELVKARRSVGLKGPKIMKFAEDMYLSPDIYKEYIVILDKNFPSPINDNYKSNYRFYLTDSLVFQGKRCYLIQFKPKQKESIAFTGQMYIADTSFAVARIDLEFSITANVNFVRSYWIRQDYAQIDGKHNMLLKSQVLGDFTVVENSKEMTGFFGRKTSEYRNFKINQPESDNFYSQLDRVTFDDSSALRNENYWNAVRGDTLNKQEKSVISMIDTLEKQAKFRLLKNSVKSITSGWIPFKKIEIGDFYSFYSYNDVEKSRVKIGLRATHLFNDHLSFKSFLAYGTYDKRFKYLTEGQVVLTRNRSKETRVGGKLRNDVVQPGRSNNLFPLDHILNVFSNLGNFNNRSLVDDKLMFLERQWITGFTSRIGVFQSQWKPFGTEQYREQKPQQFVQTISNYNYSGLQVSFRFSVGDRKLSANFGEGIRGNSFPEFPVISFHYEKALKGFLASDFNADKIKLRVEEKLRITKLGYSLFRIEGGKTWGILPFNFLETPTANPILFSDETSFNLLNYLEFVSDAYVSVMFEHHFEGLLLNRIPVIKKLKWRELILAKMYAGSLSEKNKSSIYERPASISYLNKPYWEVGFGIENIFKFSRIDFLWRLDYNEHSGTYHFLAKPMFQFKF